MKKTSSVSIKCCATCIYWDGEAKYIPGLFRAKVEYDDSETANCNKNSFWTTKTCKGTDGGGFIFSCIDWKQRY